MKMRLYFVGKFDPKDNDRIIPFNGPYLNRWDAQDYIDNHLYQREKEGLNIVVVDLDCDHV